MRGCLRCARLRRLNDGLCCRVRRRTRHTPRCRDRSRVTRRRARMRLHMRRPARARSCVAGAKQTRAARRNSAPRRLDRRGGDLNGRRHLRRRLRCFIRHQHHARRRRRDPRRRRLSTRRAACFFGQAPAHRRAQPMPDAIQTLHGIGRQDLQARHFRGRRRPGDRDHQGKTKRRRHCDERANPNQPGSDKRHRRALSALLHPQNVPRHKKSTKLRPP